MFFSMFLFIYVFVLCINSYLCFFCLSVYIFVYLCVLCFYLCFYRCLCLYFYLCFYLFYLLFVLYISSYLCFFRVCLQAAATSHNKAVYFGHRGLVGPHETRVHEATALHMSITLRARLLQATTAHRWHQLAGAQAFVF